MAEMKTIWHMQSSSSSDYLAHCLLTVNVFYCWVNINVVFVAVWYKFAVYSIRTTAYCFTQVGSNSDTAVSKCLHVTAIASPVKIFSCWIVRDLTWKIFTLSKTYLIYKKYYQFASHIMLVFVLLSFNALKTLVGCKEYTCSSLQNLRPDHEKCKMAINIYIYIHTYLFDSDHIRVHKHKDR